MHGVQGAVVGPVGPGDTAILPDGSKSGGHLNIVLCEPVGLDDRVILVNVNFRTETLKPPLNSSGCARLHPQHLTISLR